MLVTVFTPIFNRAHLISRTYESLCHQTCFDFEWLLINDGSTDGTHDVIEKIISEHDDRFPIHYIKKENEGLMCTINRALDEANGLLFCRLDSDDYATENLIESIVKYWPLIAHTDAVCALVFCSLKPPKIGGGILGYHPFNEIVRCNFTRYRDKFGATGDRCEVMKTEVFRKFKFPRYEGEKFCPEGLIWNRIAKLYDALYIPEGVYVKDEEADSITAKIYDCLKKNCHGTSQYYYEILMNRALSFKYRWINSIKYYRFAFFAHRNIFKNIPVYFVLTALPCSLLIILYDVIKYHR